MQSRKETSWKKSRKFGDVKGGRLRPKLANNIFHRAHSLQKPAGHAQLPIYIIDNPSRDFFFPVGQEELEVEIKQLSSDDWSGITHIWLRRFKKSEYEANEFPLAEFCCGSGVRLIILYPWPLDLEWKHGSKKPSARLQKTLNAYDAKLVFRDGTWISKWEKARLKDLYIEYLLFHEIGHHVDWYSRHWSRANRRTIEEAADQYAYSKTTKRSLTYKADNEGAGI